MTGSGGIMGRVATAAAATIPMGRPLPPAGAAGVAAARGWPGVVAAAGGGFARGAAHGGPGVAAAGGGLSGGSARGGAGLVAGRAMRAVRGRG